LDVVDIRRYIRDGVDLCGGEENCCKPGHLSISKLRVLHSNRAQTQLTHNIHHDLPHFCQNYETNDLFCRLVALFFAEWCDSKVHTLRDRAPATLHTQLLSPPSITR
jgi:hypothetical protein